MAYSINAQTNDITLVRGDYFPCVITMTKNGEPFTHESRGDRMTKGDIITLIICALSGISIELLSAKMNDWWKKYHS